MKNLDVYRTFRVQLVIYANRCRIKGLPATGPRNRGSLGPDRSARCSVVLIGKNPFVSGPGSTASRLFSSCVGTKPSATTPSTQHAYSGHSEPEPTRYPVEHRDGDFTA